MKKLVLTLVAILFVAVTFAEGWRNNEMEVKVTVSSKQEALQLTKLRLNGDYFIDYALLYVIPEELDLIRNSGLKFEITKENLNEYYKDFWETRASYHSYQEIIDLADSLADNFPDICTKYVFGTSLGGRQLAALKISDNSAIDENEAEVMFDGGIHGDEICGPENIIRFARDLCLGYGTDPDITDLVDNRETWLYLMVNPDGRVSVSRTNNNGVDLNRDWGYMWDGWGNSTGAFSQVESKALRACSYDNQFVVHTTYHGGTEYISCPWSYRSSEPHDMDRILNLAGVYSSVSGYSNLEYGQGNTGMYDINGSTKDSNYGAMGSISWSMEISYDKQPPASQLMMYYNRNVPSMMAMMEYSGYGIGGLVTDEVSGDPVAAAIFVENYLPCFTDPQVGDFHKYLLPGTYDIMVKANGYNDKLVTGVVVTANNGTVENIELTPLDHQSVWRIISSRIPDNNDEDPGITWNVIGQPDNLYYSIGKNGWIVVDMLDVIFDGSGPDIMVFEGDATDEGFTLYAAESMDGPFHLMGTGSGTSEFDFANCAISEARYFKILDDGDGSGNVLGAGFDFDAMQSLSSITGPYIVMEGYVVDDSNGNNNGQLDPGETVDYIITLKNVGSESAIDLEGTLSCNDVYVSVITTSPQMFGTLGVNESATATYAVMADESTPIGHSTVLELAYEGSNVTPSSKYIEVLFPDYCEASTGTEDEWIANVLCGDIDNSSGWQGGVANYTDISTTIEPGMSETITITNGNAWASDIVTAWVDWNLDMEFGNNANETFELTNVGGTGETFEGDIEVPAGQMAGNYRMRIRMTYSTTPSPCGSSSYGEVEDYTIVVAGNVLSADFTSDITELCYGNEVHFYDNSTGIITSWEWEFAGGTPATSSAENPVVTYNTPGIWGVTLTVGDGTTTNTASMMDYIYVHDNPEVPDPPSGLDEMCQDSPNSTYVVNNGSGPFGWIWEIVPEEAGTMIPAGVSVEIDWNPDYAGMVEISVACENMCGTSDMSDPLGITILPLPGVAGDISGDDVVCQEQVAIYVSPAITDADDYEWMIDPAEAGSFVISQNECTITWSDSYEGTAIINVRGVNDCGNGDWSPDFDVLVQNCTGVRSQGLLNKIAIYPNPGNGLFNIDISDLQLGSFKVTIINSLGSAVYFQEFDQSEKSLKIDLSNYPDGIYYLKLEDGSFTGMKKIIIQQ
jgi:PKD repeat protein